MSDSIILSGGSSGSGGGGGSNASVGLTGAPAPTSATELGIIVAGNLVGVSAANPIPISGTITANNASVGATGAPAPAFATEIGVIDISGNLVGASATNPVRIDPTGTTVQPISGTVTANIGTTGGLALDTSVNGLLLAQGSNSTGQKGPLVQGAVTTAVPGYTNGDTSPLSLDPNGNLRIVGAAATGSGSPGTAINIAFVTGGTFQQVTAANPFPTTIISSVALSENLTQINGNPVITAASGTLRVGIVDGLSGARITGTPGQPFSGNGVTVGGSDGTNFQAFATDTSGRQKVDLFGSGGTVMDFAGQNAAQPANALLVGAEFNTTPTTISSGNASPLQVDNVGNLLVNIKNQGTATNLSPATQAITVQDAASTATTVANGQSFITGTPTAGSAALFVLGSGYDTADIQVTGTWTGTLSVEGSVDGGVTFTALAVHQSGVSYTSSTYTANFAASGLCVAATHVRVRATAAWTGTATVLAVFSIAASSVLIKNPITLRDPTTQSISNTIKAASTAVVATDTALVVGISPNTAVRVVGNAGGIFDGATAAAVPANAVQGGFAAATALPTAVTGGQLVAGMSDKFGREAVVLNTVRNLVGTAALSSSSASAVSFITAGGANVFNDIITLVITNSSATPTTVTLSDNGAAGNTYLYDIAGNGGIVINFPTPLPQGTANAAWDVLNSAGVALHYSAVFAKNQ